MRSMFVSTSVFRWTLDRSETSGDFLSMTFKQIKRQIGFDWYNPMILFVGRMVEQKVS